MKSFTRIYLSLIMIALTCATTYSQDSETRSLNDFHGVSVSSSIDAEVMKGSKNSVEIISDGVDLDKVSTEIKDGILRIGYKKNSGSGWNWGMKKKKVRAVVTFSGQLDYLGASSSGDLTVEDKIVGEHVEVSASSSGDVSVEVDADHLEVRASSSGDIVISGTAAKADLSASSSGDIIGKNLSVNHANAKASSSGDISVKANQSIHARASSGGDIIYYGSPSQKDVKKSSGGDIVHKN